MKIRIMIAVLLFFPGPCAVFAEEADIVWQHRATQGAVTLTANPLGKTSRVSFYEARGFSAQQARPYGEACGFSFGFRNGGATPVSVKLADWRVIGADGVAIAFKLPEAWDTDWARAGVSQPARIAFRWAQFQSDIAFEPGDWIMGMATLERAPVGPFRLVARYSDKNDTTDATDATDTRGNHEIVIDRIECARD
jgi:hypothetical protein